MDYKKLEKVLKEEKQPSFRLDQITRAIFGNCVTSFDDITTISKELRSVLSQELDIFPFEVKEAIISKDNRAIKALFELRDGNVIESVLISPKPETWSACISSQVGCAMACEFCATGKLGLGRDLTTDEIVSQAVFWKCYLRENNIKGSYTNIVYMGMGEPFMNWDNVKESIDVLVDEKKGHFSKRGISVSTSGVVPGITKFADECGQINLAISLHFATNEKRDKYMPVNKAYNLETLAESLRYYLSKNNRRLFVEYIMLKGINDSDEDARLLVKYLKTIGKKQLLIVNLIKYNTIDSGFAPSSKKTVMHFKKLIKEGGVPCTIRKSIGDDIHGACGQLAGKDKCK
jgi:23S rRNA (adenine2503-C2)-methyltransferase